MRHRHELHQAFFAGRSHCLHVAVQHGLERLFGLPAGVLRRQLLDAIENEGELDVHRLLDPERAVIVEGCDALIFGHEVRTALGGHARHKLCDRVFHRTIVPGWQWIGLRQRR